MTILFLCEKTDGKDGWSRYTKDLLATLESRGHETHVLSTATGLPSPLSMLSRPWRAYFLARKVASYCRKNTVDAIHITVEPYGLCASFLPKDLQKKTVLTAHGSYGVRPLQYWQTKWLATRMYRAVAACITVSNFTKKRILEELKRVGHEEGTTPFTVITNAVPSPPPYEARAENERKIIICVGGVKPRKGILESLEGCARYRDAHGDAFQFFIVGKTDESDAYVRLVHERITSLELTEHVTLTGRLSDEEIEQYYRKADVFLMPAKTTETTFEGFGIVFLEANRFGVPCIGPKESGAAEAISEGKSGFHVEPEDSAGMAVALHRILEKKEINAQECIAWATAHNLEKQTDAVEAVYKTLIS